MVAAASGGHVDIMKWVGPSFIARPAIWAAVETENLEPLRWCISQKRKVAKAKWKTVAKKAAAKGKLSVQFAMKKKPYEAKQCRALILRAAAGGHIEVVKWIHEQHRASLDYDVAIQAAKNGHLDILQWMHSIQWWNG